MMNKGMASTTTSNDIGPSSWKYLPLLITKNKEYHLKKKKKLPYSCEPINSKIICRRSSLTVLIISNNLILIEDVRFNSGQIL